MKVEYIRPARRKHRAPVLDYLVLFLAIVAIWALGFLAGTLVCRSSPETPAPVAPVVKVAEAPVPVAAVVVEEPEPISLGEFKVTHYCSCERCCNEWADGITYTGTVATEGRTIAVDPDVIPLGSTVVIDGHEYIAEDIGGAIQGNRIDVYMDSHEAALVEGVKYEEVFLDA